MIDLIYNLAAQLGDISGSVEQTKSQRDDKSKSLSPTLVRVIVSYY